MSRDFKFPAALLKQINECSNGGYLLFNFDADGKPGVFFQSDSDLHTIAIMAHAETYIMAAKAAHEDVCIQSMQNPIDIDDLDEFNDEDDDSDELWQNKDPDC